MAEEPSALAVGQNSVSQVLDFSSCGDVKYYPFGLIIGIHLCLEGRLHFQVQELKHVMIGERPSRLEMWD